jgi:hypothetical protein
MQLQIHTEKHSKQISALGNELEILQKENAYWKECTSRLEITLQDQQQQKQLLQTLLQEERSKLLHYDASVKERDYQKQVFLHYMEDVIHWKDLLAERKHAYAHTPFTTTGIHSKHLPIPPSMCEAISSTLPLPTNPSNTSITPSQPLPKSTFDDYDLIFQATR